MTFDEEFIWRVYTFVAAEQTRLALDLIFDRIDELLLREDFERIEGIFRIADVPRLGNDASMGFLTATYIAKERLPERKNLVEAVRRLLSQNRPEKHVQRILAGLE